VGGGKIHPDDQALRPNVVCKPLQCFPGTASHIEDAHAGRKAQAGDGFAKLGFRARVEEPQFARVVARHRIIQQPRQSVRSIH
jgi:hypothetical protein